jgi:hypothetical protein
MERDGSPDLEKRTSGAKALISGECCGTTACIQLKFSESQPHVCSSKNMIKCGLQRKAAPACCVMQTMACGIPIRSRGRWLS